MDATDREKNDRERLSAWLDGELSPEETRALLARLEADPELRREAEEWRRTWDLLGRYPDEPVPEGFADRVLAKAVGGEGGASARESAGRTAGGAGEGASSAPPLRLVPGGARRFAVAAAVLLAVGVGAVVASRAPAPARVGSDADLLEAMPAEAVENLSALAAFSDAEFEAILESDPDELARLLDEAQGG